MPSQFETSFAAALQALYATFGLAGTYTAPDGTAAVPCTVRLHRQEAMQVLGKARVSEVSQTGMIFVRQSDLANPVKDGRFRVESTETWTIVEAPVLKNGEFKCTVRSGGPDRFAPMRAKGTE
jgi:hypothetical protein